MSLTVVIITKNEERNLRACLESVKPWTQDIFVVDSDSVDATVEIPRALGDKVFNHPFEPHARQWEWALTHLPIKTDWVMGLDADQRVTPELSKEIAEFIDGQARIDTSIEAAYVKRRQIFRGKWIRHGGYYPKYLLKLFRAASVVVDGHDLVDHHFRVRGKSVKLKCDIVEDNRNEADISTWIDKHNRYAALQALEEHRKYGGPSQGGFQGKLLGSPDERIARLKSLWARMPLYIRPVVYFLCRYFFRLGFLDGKQGFIFHFMQAFWYRLLVDINLDQLRSETGTGKAAEHLRSPEDKEDCIPVPAADHLAAAKDV